ncbi:MAG: imidazoleglycerol-phosphate dehydratase HisB [Clostridiales bacterium]|nr:imidazoleglycerol-phosphate dehydratase HisB [Clostridiales bacterium]
MNRYAATGRVTKETDINVEINLDGTGKIDVDTGVGFFDHMLTGFARHGGFDLMVKCTGDLEVDAHHTVEDIGIAIGQTIKEALGDKKGITRYGFASVPMDEALANCSLDISGRAYLVFSCDFAFGMCGTMDTQLAEEFFRAVAFNSDITLHLSCPYGTNDHHKMEALFKAFGRALRQAVAIDPRFEDAIPSTKGVL